MNAARGTRRPHPRRVYKRARKPSRTKSSGVCVVLILASAGIPAAVSVITL